ncbi:MAG: hypothetical protein WC740_19305 [Verrucomicrobiia bacterium]
MAYQCGFVIRLFQTPEEKRCDFAISEDASRKVAELFTKGSFPAESRQMGEYLLNGLLSQLRTYPIGLRIDQWLMRDYPDLRTLQERGIQTQLEQNSQAIGPGLGKMFPPLLYGSNQSMNAAFALFWGRTWGNMTITLPYKATGFFKKVEALIKIFDQIPPEPIEDRRLVDE